MAFYYASVKINKCGCNVMEAGMVENMGAGGWMGG